MQGTPKDGFDVLVSIITISHNQGEYIHECIQSVLMQDYDNIEYVVVDAGSTDKTLRILKNVQDLRFKFISEADEGPADGLSKGFQRCHGDIVCYLNSDDMLLPGAIATVIDVIKRNPHIDVLYGDGIQVDGAGNFVRKLTSDPWSLKAHLYGGASIIQQSTFFRSSIYKQAGGFNIDNRTCWDGELLVRMAQIGAKFYHLKHTLGAFRVHPTSITGSGRLEIPYRKDLTRIRESVTGPKSNLFVLLNSLFYLWLKRLRAPLAAIERMRFRMHSSRRRSLAVQR